MKSDNDKLLARTLYLYNPLSNGGKSVKMWEKLRTKYDFLPETPYDVTSIAELSKFIQEQNADLVVVMGGDGTINSVASSVVGLTTKPTLSVIPLGFGNAVAYNLGVDTLDRAVEVLQNTRKVVTMDVVRTNIPTLPYGLFAVSIGFDAHVVLDKDSKYLRKINPYSYILSAISVSFSHKPKNLRILIDKKFELETSAASLLVANGPIIGKNLRVSDNAKYNDGLLNCTIFMSKASYVKNLRYKGIKHPLYRKNDGKIVFSAKHLVVAGESYVQVDGEATTMDKPIELSIDEHKLNFLSA